MRYSSSYGRGTLPKIIEYNKEGKSVEKRIREVKYDTAGSN